MTSKDEITTPVHSNFALNTKNTTRLKLDIYDALCRKADKTGAFVPDVCWAQYWEVNPYTCSPMRSTLLTFLHIAPSFSGSSHILAGKLDEGGTGLCDTQDSWSLTQSTSQAQRADPCPFAQFVSTGGSFRKQAFTESCSEGRQARLEHRWFEQW
jgi:hypothetical protein